MRIRVTKEIPVPDASKPFIKVGSAHEVQHIEEVTAWNARKVYFVMLPDNTWVDVYPDECEVLPDE